MSELESTRRGRINFGSRVPGSVLTGIVESLFPDRLIIHWLPPDRAMTDGFSIVITSEVLLHVSRHVARTLDHELGGFLLGNRCRCPTTGREYVTIDQYVEAESAKSTEVSFTFTHEAWASVNNKLTGKFHGKMLLGWYHSHPRMSIFLSEDDLDIHRERFAKPWMVALVLEPEKHLGGFFAWSNGKVDPNRYVNFYELLDGEKRESVVAWKNYDGFDPSQSTAPVLSRTNTQSAPAAEMVPPKAAPPAALLGPVGDVSRKNVSWFKPATLALIAVMFFGGLVIAYLYGSRKTESAESFTHPGPSVDNKNTTPQPTPTATPTQTPVAEQQTQQKPKPIPQNTPTQRNANGNHNVNRPAARDGASNRRWGWRGNAGDGQNRPALTPAELAQASAERRKRRMIRMAERNKTYYTNLLNSLRAKKNKGDLTESEFKNVDTKIREAEANLNRAEETLKIYAVP